MISPIAEIAWTDEAYMITPDNPLEMDVSWDNIYQPLEAGRYRIGKDIMCYYGPGEYDSKMCIRDSPKIDLPALLPLFETILSTNYKQWADFPFLP